MCRLCCRPCPLCVKASILCEKASKLLAQPHFHAPGAPEGSSVLHITAFHGRHEVRSTRGPVEKLSEARFCAAELKGTA